MNLILYQRESDLGENLEDFLNAYYNRNMSCLASDLLKEGFSAGEIVDAVRRAMSMARSAGISVRKHFRLVYTTLDGAIVRDCKMTRHGYALVLLNGPADNASVAVFQTRLIRHFLKNKEQVH
jgi:hypothetical protein